MDDKTTFLIIFGVAMLLLLNVGGLGDSAKNLFSSANPSGTTGTTGTTTGTTGSTTGSLCPDTSATVKLLSTDAFSPSASVTGSDTVLTYTDGAWVNQGTYADGSSLTLGMNTKYKVIFRENSTSYYPQLESGVVGYPDGQTSCTGQQTVKAYVEAYDTSFGKGYITDKDGSLNADGAYNIANGEAVTATVTVPATAKKGFGAKDAGPNVIVCEYNTTEISSFTLSDAGSDVKTYTTGISAPQRYQNNLSGSPGKALLGFDHIENNQNLKYHISVVADPTYGGTPSQNPYCRYFDACIYRDSVTDALTTGLEDTQATTTDKCQTASQNTTWSLS